MQTAIAYTRVSSDDQIKGTSLDTQIAEIKTYCDRQNIAILNHYTDAGESAKTADRPGLIDALESCRKKNVTFLLVHRLDRLSRNATDGLAIRAKLASHKTQIMSVSEPLSDEPAGQFMSAIMFAAAQFDNDIRSARSRTGMSATTAKGGWAWRAPTGYRLERRDDGLPVLSIFAQDAPHLAELLDAYATGRNTLMATIQGFHDAGFDRTKANKIFHQPVYGGIIRSKLARVDILAAFPSYITPEQWYMLETRYAEDKRHPRKDKPSTHGFHLSLCTCAVCGSRLKGSNAKSGSGKLYPYYRCPNGHANLRAADLAAAIEDAISGLTVLSDELAQAVEITTGILREEGKDQKKIEHRRLAEIAKLKDNLTSLAEKYVESEIDHTTYKTLQVKYNSKIAALQEEAKDTDDPQGCFDRAVALVNAFKNIRFAWRQLDPKSQRDFLVLFPKPPRYNPATKKVELDFDQAGIDKTENISVNVQMAPPRGVEPLFPG